MSIYLCRPCPFSNGGANTHFCNSDVPQFVTLTVSFKLTGAKDRQVSNDITPHLFIFVVQADDAVQQYTIDALNSLVNGRKNPNGCNVSTTYFTSLDYTNYSMVTNFYVAGNEVADHTVTHVAQPSVGEVSRCWVCYLRGTGSFGANIRVVLLRYRCREI